MEAMQEHKPGQTRLRWAQAGAAAALWCLPALVLTLPRGLLPFGLLVLATTVLVPRQMLAAVRLIGWRWWLAATAVVVPLLVVAVSIRLGGALHGLDGPSRWLGLPWLMAWAWALQPPREMLWRGALVGLVAAAALALVQVLGGEARPGAWVHPIVFANVVLALMVLVVFCRPLRSWHWTGLGLLLGTLAILLSGTRGVWPGLGLLWLVLMLGSGWRSRRSRILLAGALVVAGIVALASVPALTEHTRLVRLQVAARAVSQAPWTGVGYHQFDRAMQQVPECRGEAGRQVERCHYGHAHNDLAEWAATMGIPGVLALGLLYGVPLGLFLWLRPGIGPGPLRGAASAGAMVVAVFMLGGMTQSMFAHQTTAAVYAALCGLLLGLALREAGRCARDDGPGVSTKV